MKWLSYLHCTRNKPTMHKSITSRSLASLVLWSHHDAGLFHEDMVSAILDDLRSVLKRL